MGQKKLHSLARRLTAMVLCGALMLSLPGMPAVALAEDVEVTDTDKETLSGLNSQYEKLEQQQKAAQDEINKAKSEKDRQLAIKQQLNNQVEMTRQQIGILSEQIRLLDETIAEQQRIIEEKEKEIDRGYDAFKSRMRASYIAGNSSTLGMLLGAESVADFLTRAEITTRIAEKDNETITKLESDLAAVQEAKEELEQNESDLETAKTSQAAKQGELNGQVAQVQSQIEDISALQKDYEQNKARIDAEMAQVQSEIDSIYASYKSEGTYDGGVMTWPVPGYSNITSYYGWRFNNTDYHTGIDISGANVYRKPIVAAADGTVMYTQQSYKPGVGYGRYLMIDHGGGISTLYGHTDELLVSVGQHVSRGQTIALVGTTGWSTGPHLHFEVRVDGKHTNPLSGYLK